MKFTVWGLALSFLFLVNTPIGWADPLIREPDKTTVVVVKPGDSLWKIAQRSGNNLNPAETVRIMRQLNKLGKYIHPGDRLVVPAAGFSSWESYSVQVASSNQIPSRGAGERFLVCDATAYCYTGYRTASMTWPSEGRTIAVDPRVIPLRSKVYVSCDTWPRVNGIYIAEDTGGLIKGNKIDIYMIDRNQALQWGRRRVQVRVLEYPDSL
jgi:3D (Asp-Asp-Asp) domain-containing protein